MLFSVDVLFGKAAGTDIEVPVLEEMLEEEEEKKLLDNVGEVSSTQAKPKVPQKLLTFAAFCFVFFFLFYMQLR